MNDPIAILKRDHREAEAMLKQLAESKPGATRRRVTEKLSAALALHMEIEERLVYPLVAERVGEEEEREAETEHELARAGISRMNELDDEPGFGAAVAMVTAGIKHHVKEEEKEIFPSLKRNLDRDDWRVSATRSWRRRRDACRADRGRDVAARDLVVRGAAERGDLDDGRMGNSRRPIGEVERGLRSRRGATPPAASGRVLSADRQGRFHEHRAGRVDGARCPWTPSLPISASTLKRGCIRPAQRISAVRFVACGGDNPRRRRGTRRSRSRSRGRVDGAFRRLDPIIGGECRSARASVARRAGRRVRLGRRGRAASEPARAARATLAFRAGWQWAAVEGSVELAGPDDPMEGIDAERLRVLLRDIFAAAGGSHDDWDEYDRVMASERRVAVLVDPERIYGNR